MPDKVQIFLEDFIQFYTNVKDGCYTDVIAQIELEKLHERARELNGTDEVTLNTVKKLGQKIRKNKQK
jgi:hypothetical protein